MIATKTLWITLIAGILGSSALTYFVTTTVVVAQPASACEELLAIQKQKMKHDEAFFNAPSGTIRGNGGPGIGGPNSDW